MRGKRIIAIALTLSLTTALFGCSASPGGGGTDAAYELPKAGEVIHGFQVTARGSIDSLNAQTASFLHVSGQRISGMPGSQILPVQWIVLRKRSKGRRLS